MAKQKQMTDDRRQAAENKEQRADDGEQMAEKNPSSVIRPLSSALQAYGIEPEFLMGFADVDGGVVLVTVGGSKVVWREGMDVTPLTRIQITGINPANANRKPITGGKR